jgi:ribosomal protein S7
MKHMPKVMQDQIKKNSGSRSFSTSARSRLPDVQETNSAREDPSIAMVASMIGQVTERAQGQEAETPSGLKFDPPVSPANTRTLNFRKRYDTLQEQFTKMIMEDGKLSRAQKVMASILDQLRTSPAPQVNARRRLLGAPPAPQLPLDPVLYLTLIVDSVAPLFRIRQQKGLTGGGTAVQIPHPLTLRQRRRSAIKWIIDASDKRRDTHLAQRIANELLAVAEGRSGVWERRDQQHKLGIAGRANLGLAPRRR